MKFYLIFLFLLIGSNESREKIVGNIEDYNLKIIVEINPEKKTDKVSFEHVVKEKIYFRYKSHVLSTETIDAKSLNGYFLTGINRLKSNGDNIYQMEYYKSNGSPEIYIYYSKKGEKLCKQTVYRERTEYNFIKKGLNERYFDEFKLSDKYDLTDLY